MTGDLSSVTHRNGAHPTRVEADRDVGGRDLSSPGGGVGRVVAPIELCRLTVVAESVQVDLALPTDIPIALLLPGIVEVLGDRASAASNSARAWVLSKVGRPPIDGTATLNEAAVHDGDLLVLGNALDPAPPPLFDDLMYAVATTGTPASGLWTARTARSTGFAVASVAVMLGCLALLRSSVAAAPGTTVSVPLATAAAVAGTLFVVAGTIVSRVYRDRRTGVVLSSCALPLVFTAGIAFVPGALGAPHLLLGSAAAGTTAVLAARSSGQGAAVFTAAATAAFAAVGATSVLVFTNFSVSTVGTGVAVIALAALAFAPRLSMMQARLPLPPVPTAGAPLDDADDADRPGIENLDELSSRARSYLTGLVYACSAAATVGALLAALGSPSSTAYWPGIALALLISLVLILRGRTFAEVQHAVPLVAGGAGIGVTLLAVAVFAAPGMAATTFCSAIAVAGAALVFGSAVPARSYSPVLRRAAELAEYAAIAAVVPLACWVCGLYTAMRGL